MRSGDSRVVADRFRDNLVRLRKAAGLSQEELGYRSGLHRTEIGMLEHGHRLPRIDTLVKLSRGLEVLPGVFLEGIEWKATAWAEGSFGVRPEGEERS